MRAKSVKFFLSLSILFLAVSLTLSGAEAAGRLTSAQNDGGWDVPPEVLSFEIRQMGAADLTVDIKGRDMPLPQIHNQGNSTVIALPGVSGANVKPYEYDGMFPLVTGVRYRQSGPDFVIMIMTEKPIEPNAVRGVPPCDAYTLRLKTSEQAQKIATERVTTDHPQTLRVPTGPFASNAPIDMDLRDTELRDVFRMFGEQVKKNIVIHDSLPPVLVTMTFKKAALSSVFSYIMKNYDLAYDFIDKDTIIVGTAAGLGRISGKEETRFYRIAYATPESVAELLPRLTKVSAANLVVDARLRTLYVTGTPDVQEEVVMAIQKLDNPGKQVMLHARILQFNKGDELEVSKALNAVYDHWAFSYANGALGGLYADDNRVGRPSGITGDDDGRLLPPGLGSATNFTTPLQGVWREFDASFRALETKRRTKTLANPSVVTIDGQEASISLTEDYPYVSGRDESGNATWSSVSVGPQLKILPQVGRDGMITMNLDLQASETAGMVTGSLGEQMPQTSRRQVLTNVRVHNGEPFVVGGLFREDDINNVLRIPILGELPLLGELFTMRTKTSSTTQVVMVVVPIILDTPDSAVEHERVMMKQ